MRSQGRKTLKKRESKLKTTKCKFTTEDDIKLRNLVKQYGTKSWSLISSKFKNRNTRQCRDRWNNYLNPRNDNSKWTNEEDIQLINLFFMIGKQWSKLSCFFPKRTPVNIRNRCRMILKNMKQNYSVIEQNQQCEFNNQMLDSYEPINAATKYQIENMINSDTVDQFSESLNDENGPKIEQKVGFPNDQDTKQSKNILPPCIDLPFHPFSPVKQTKNE